MTPEPDVVDCHHPADACKWNIWNSRFQCHCCGASDLVLLPDPLTTKCAVAGCDYWPVDVRGPVCLDNAYYWVCQEHWESIIGIVGRQIASNDAQIVDATVGLTGENPT